MRSGALPNSPTPTAWWPSEGRRTSTGAAGAQVSAGSGVAGWLRGCWESGAQTPQPLNR